MLADGYLELQTCDTALLCKEHLHSKQYHIEHDRMTCSSSPHSFSGAASKAAAHFFCGCLWAVLGIMVKNLSLVCSGFNIRGFAPWFAWQVIFLREHCESPHKALLSKFKGDKNLNVCSKDLKQILQRRSNMLA